MSVRIFRLVTKICVKNILRIFQAHFRENVKNTEPGRKFHHSYKKKRVHLCMIYGEIHAFYKKRVFISVFLSVLSAFLFWLVGAGFKRGW